MAHRKDDLTTISQAGTIAAGGLAATDFVSTAFGSDIKQDGRVIMARFMVSITADSGGALDIADAVFRISSPELSATQGEEAIEAVPDRRHDTTFSERAGRYVRPMGLFRPPGGDATSGYASNLDTEWFKVMTEFFADITTILNMWIYNMGTGAFDAQTTVRWFGQLRVKFA